MKCFNWTMIVTVACLFVFSGCNNADESGETESDTDTDTDTDSDTDTDTDTDSDVPEEDYEFQFLFECPDSVEEPADFVGYKDYPQGAEVEAFFDMVWSEAMVWFDESCLVECEAIPPQVECWEAECETDAGATMSYYYMRTEEGPDHYQESSLEEILEIIPPPDTESWQEIIVEKIDIVTPGGDGWGHLLEQTASWVGTIEEDWPSDYGVYGIIDSCSDPGFEEYDIEWSHDSCDLIASRDNYFEYYETLHYDIEVEVNDNKVRVFKPPYEEEYKGWVNGDFIGFVDQETWEIIGE